MKTKKIDRDKMIERIADELQAHNEAIGAGDRPRERLLSDAKFVMMVRHDGISVETLAMITTDAFFAVLKG